MKASCPVCSERGELWNVLREGDRIFDHEGNHAVVHRFLHSSTAMSIDCPSRNEAARAIVTKESA